MDANVFRVELEKFMDSESPNFVRNPYTIQEANGMFSDALIVLASTIVPLVNAAVFPSAKLAYVNVASGMVMVVPGIAPTIFPSAMSAFAASLVPGFQPVFTATPPMSPINLLPIIGGAGYNLTNSQILDIFVPIVVNWFRTGVAVNVSTGVAVNWN